jgi:hypothetical protein
LVAGGAFVLGLDVFGTRPPAGSNPVRVIISLAAFAAGAALEFKELRVKHR